MAQKRLLVFWWSCWFCDGGDNVEITCVDLCGTGATYWNETILRWIQDQYKKRRSLRSNTKLDWISVNKYKSKSTGNSIKSIKSSFGCPLNGIYRWRKWRRHAWPKTAIESTGDAPTEKCKLPIIPSGAESSICLWYITRVSLFVSWLTLDQIKTIHRETGSPQCVTRT